MSDAVEGEVVAPKPEVKPTKYDEAIVTALETAFNHDFNITEACQYAGIHRSTYYEWLAEDDVFSYRMSIAQAMPKRMAKEIVIKAIQTGDPNLALRYLTLRDPDFKPKAEVGPPPELQSTREKLKGFFNDIKQHDPGGESPATDGALVRGEVPESPTDIS